MQELGFNTVSAALLWGAIGIDEETGEARIVDEEAWRNWLYHFDQMRDREFEVASLFGMGWTLFLNRCPHFLRRSSIDGMRVDDIRLSEEAKEPAAKMIRLFYTAARERSWPEIYFYMADELGNHGRRGSRYGQELAKFLQEIKPMVGYPYKVFYSTLSAEIAEPMLPDLDIVCPNSAFPLDGKTLDLVRSKGPDLWIYNAGVSRLSYGYYLWLVDAKGRLQWSMNYVMSVPDVYFGFANVGHINTVLDPDWNCIPTEIPPTPAGPAPGQSEPPRREGGERRDRGTSLTALPRLHRRGQQLAAEHLRLLPMEDRRGHRRIREIAVPTGDIRIAC